MERRGLGKGLSELLGTSAADQGVRQIPLDQIAANPLQPRQSFDGESLQEMAESIRSVGILQPIIVRQIADDRFELIAGERRVRAAKIAGQTTVPAIVRQSDGDDSLALALIENVQREDINPMEESRAYYQLIRRHGMTQEQIAARVGKKRPTIANKLRLMNLTEDAQSALIEGKITESHAKFLLSLEPERQDPALQMIIEKDLSVSAATDQFGRKLKPRMAVSMSSRYTEALPPAPAETPLERELSLALGYKTRIRSSPGGINRLTIEFYSDEDLDRLVSLLAPDGLANL